MNEHSNTTATNDIRQMTNVAENQRDFLFCFFRQGYILLHTKDAKYYSLHAMVHSRYRLQHAVDKPAIAQDTPSIDRWQTAGRRHLIGAIFYSIFMVCRTLHVCLPSQAICMPQLSRHPAEPKNRLHRHLVTCILSLTPELCRTKPEVNANDGDLNQSWNKWGYQQASKEKLCA